MKIDLRKEGVLAALRVLAINHDWWLSHKDHPISAVRRIALRSKTRALVAHDQTLAEIEVILKKAGV